MRSAIEILRSIVADVEAMLVKKPGGQPHVFGPFSEGMTESSGTYVEWPNLGILMLEAKRVVEPKPEDFVFTPREKEMAMIVDQLCPIVLQRTGNYVTPDIFKQMVKRLEELLQ